MSIINSAVLQKNFTFLGKFSDMNVFYFQIHYFAFIIRRK